VYDRTPPRDQDDRKPALDIEKLILEYQTWFYAITFLWTFLEGESFVIIAGAASFKGHLNIYWLILAAWIGSFCGDQIYFLLGRYLGKRIIARFPKFEGGVQVALDMLHKYHTLFILSYRYIYGVRNVASFAMGMSELPWPRFASLNFIAAFIWANSFAWAGYLIGKAFEAVLGDITQNFGYIMLGVFVFVVCLLTLIHWRAKKRHQKRRASEAASAGRVLEDKPGQQAGRVAEPAGE
jgi:membrane protein DedA with SNARE-associated domain